MPENENEQVGGKEITEDQLRSIRVDANFPGSEIKIDERAKREFEDLFGLHAIYSDNRARHEQLKRAIHRAFVAFVYITFFSFMAILVIRMLHFVLPESDAKACVHGWLSEHQLQAMDKLFFSGALGALVAKYLKIGANPPREP